MKRTFTLLVIIAAITSAMAVPPRIMGDSFQSQDRKMSSTTYMANPRKAVGTRTIIPRIPVIMVTFPNWQYGFSFSKAEVDSMFNAQNFTTGSVRKYFHDQSAGAYNPQFDIYGPVTVSKNYGYYGKASGNSYDSYPGQLAVEACQLMDSAIDFSQYDSDKDGNVDLVYILYAGMGQADESYINKTIVPTPSDLIWPHYSSVTSTGYSGTIAGRTFDGKKIYNYECSNELDGAYTQDMEYPCMAGMGLACHEFCHALGLPDLYTQNNKQIVGVWDIMDYGCYSNDLLTPPALSAYERYFMGWINPVLLNDPTDCELLPLAENNQAYIYTGSANMPATTKTGTFYIIENRQKISGSWDEFVPDEGLLVWKIQSWSSGYVNVASGNSNNKIDIIRSDGSSGDGMDYRQGYCYPYQTKDSIPNLHITDIKNEDGVVSFKFKGGSPTTRIDALDADGNAISTKIIHNGELYIRRGNKLYTITGNETNLL